MKDKLKKIADYLLLNSPYMRDIGLFHGKMGVVVALYAYSNKYGDKLLEEYAWDLLQQVYGGVHSDMPVGLEHGLAGIGYGTTLMCARGWVNCDLNDIMSEIDAKIIERDPRRMTDFSVRAGAGGLMLYLSLRQRVCGELRIFDEQYLSELQTAMRFFPTVIHPKNIVEILNKPTFDIDNYVEKPIGIDAGSAYYIIKEALG